MKKFTSNKDFNLYIRRLCKTGWLVKLGKKHDKLISPKGERFTIPGTPSDRRAFDSVKRDIKMMSAREAQ
jgi:hypothetical protein